MKKYITSLIVTLFLTHNIYAQMDGAYSKFLIFKSQAIDYYPVWGDTDNEIYINLMSKEWRKYDLSKSKFQEGTYLNHKLAINEIDNFIIITDNKTKSKLEEDKNWKPREITDKKGRKISLESDDFNTMLIFQYEKGKKEKIMDIQGNAHSLAISPSGKYLACLFEITGLMIFDIEKEITDLKKQKEIFNKMGNLEKAEYYLNNRDKQNFESTLNNFTDKEKETIEYNFYFGLMNYLSTDDAQSKLDIAIPYLLKASEDKRFYDANFMLSTIYQKKKDWQLSLKYAEKTIELMPEHPAGYCLKAEYYENAGNQKLACEFYKKAYEKGDEYVQIKLSKCD